MHREKERETALYGTVETDELKLLDEYLDINIITNFINNIEKPQDLKAIRMYFAVLNYAKINRIKISLNNTPNLKQLLSLRNLQEYNLEIVFLEAIKNIMKQFHLDQRSLVHDLLNELVKELQ